ncbi:cell division protein ZipA [Gilliamella sp. wkB178]|uniref:cell division protein ZipA n=1 Tax=Gilliamella sp. wkB178 TaxID=3120259 RepID=UPI000A593E14|nr:cell division protein ZipA [Gilliamella apicola]
MDNLRIVLIVVASLVIIALLIHGFWINKKERSSLFNSARKGKNSVNTQSYENNYQDDLGEDDVILLTPKNKKDNTNNESIVEEEVIVAEEPIIQPQQEDLFAYDDRLDDELDDAKEPTISVHNKIDNNTLETQDKKHQSEANSKPNKSEKLSLNTKDETQTEIIVLNVTGINGKLLQGDVLLASIMQSGFQFGDMRIFHRHVDPAGNGSILFSLANMVNPGYLDPETMHEFTTPGVSIFMVAPTEGNNQQNFKLMLQTAQRIADDVNGVVLDDEHHMLTPQKIDSYKNRIKKACNEV